MSVQLQLVSSVQKQNELQSISGSFLLHVLNKYENIINAGYRVPGYLVSQEEVDHLFNAIVLPNFSYALPVYGASDSDLSVIQNFLDRCMKRKFMSKNVNIRDLLEKADKTLYKKRSNDPECPFFQFLPKEKNMRYNLRNTSVSVPRIYTDRFKNVFSNRIIFRYDM